MNGEKENPVIGGKTKIIEKVGNGLNPSVSLGCKTFLPD
jgi:hypothetical protein